jgi:cobalamin biosynthesis protein CbiG
MGDVVVGRQLVLGVGCRTGADAEEVVDFAKRVLAEARLDWQSVGLVATIEQRVGHPAVEALAASVQTRVVGFAPDQLALVGQVSTPSPSVAHRIGAPGVAEPAALLASDGGVLVVTKRRSANATIAVARRSNGSCPGDESTIS